MRVMVYGGRDYANRELMFSVLDHYHAARPFTAVIEGEATGADLLARAWAEARGVLVDPYPAAWTDMVTPPVVRRFRRDGTEYNAAAGGIRNQKMLDEGRPDIGIEFPGGRGTADMRGRLQEALGVDHVIRIVE